MVQDLRQKIKIKEKYERMLLIGRQEQDNHLTYNLTTDGNNELYCKSSNHLRVAMATGVNLAETEDEVQKCLASCYSLLLAASADVR